MRTVADVLEDEGTKFILAKGESRASRAELSRALLNRTGVRISNDSGLTTLFTAHVQHQNGDTPRDLMRLDLVQLSDRADYQAKIRTGQLAHKPEHIRIKTVEGQELYARLDEDFRRIEDTLAPVEIVAAPAEDPAEAVHNLEAAIVKATRKFIKEMVALASESSENRALIKKLYEEYKAKKGSESWITKTARIPVTEALSRVTRAMKKDEENEVLAAMVTASVARKLICYIKPGSPKYREVIRAFFPNGNTSLKYHKEDYNKRGYWNLVTVNNDKEVDAYLKIAERSNKKLLDELRSSGAIKRQTGRNKPRSLNDSGKPKVDAKTAARIQEIDARIDKLVRVHKQISMSDNKDIPDISDLAKINREVLKLLDEKESLEKGKSKRTRTASVITAHGTGEPGETPDDVKAMDILSGALHGEMSPHMISVTSPFELGIRQVVGGPVVYRAMHYQGAYEVYQGSREMIRSASVRAIVDFLCGNPPTVVTASRSGFFKNPRGMTLKRIPNYFLGVTSLSSDDFHEIGIGSLKDALHAAYNIGKGVEGSARDQELMNKLSFIAKRKMAVYSLVEKGSSEDFIEVSGKSVKDGVLAAYDYGKSRKAKRSEGPPPSGFGAAKKQDPSRQLRGRV